MTWHLKDRELEKKLIAIDPKFLERINEGAELKDNMRLDTCMMINNHVFVRFEAKDFEEVPDYNPNDWNEYPKETPPEGVMMRVEVFSLVFRKHYRTCAIYFEGKWYGELDGECNCLLELGGMMKVKRFRPWSED